MAKYKVDDFIRIFDADKETGVLRTDMIFVDQGLPGCTHPYIALDSRDEVYKCIKCEFIFIWRSKAHAKSFQGRIIYGYDFVTKTVNEKGKIYLEKMGQGEKK